RRDDEDRGAAADHRRHLRNRGAVGPDPGDLVPALPPPGLPDGAGAPSLRAARVVGDEDHPALLDRRGDLLGDRLHALPTVDPLMKPRPPLPPGPYLVVGRGLSGEAVAPLLAEHGEVQIVETTQDAPGIAALEGVATVVKSPGVRPRTTLVRDAPDRGLMVVSELDIALRTATNWSILRT